MPLPALFATLLIASSILQSNGDAARAFATFHDNLAKITISYPSSFQLKTTPERDAAVTHAKDRLKDKPGNAAASVATDNVPFIAKAPKGFPFAAIEFSRFDEKSVQGPSTDAALRGIATGIMDGSVKTLTDPHIGAIVSVEMGAHNGVAQFGSAQLRPDSTQFLYAAAICFNNSGQDACILELAFDKAVLIELLHNSIQFDGEASRPLFEKPIEF